MSVAGGNTHEDDRPLTTEAAAGFLGVSPRSLERWRLQRIGPPFTKLSARAIRYNAVTLRTWRDARTVECDG